MFRVLLILGIHLDLVVGPCLNMHFRDLALDIKHIIQEPAFPVIFGGGDQRF